MSDAAEVRAEAERWLRFASEDLNIAEDELAARRGRPRHVCFNAQQAAEKALKARYVARQVQYPFVHDLDELADGLGEEVSAVTTAELVWLSQGAKAPRYPLGEVPSWEDAEASVRLAAQVLDEATRELQADT